MKFIQGYDRNQTHLFPISLEQSIDPDNEIRVIDLFVDSLPLKARASADVGFMFIACNLKRLINIIGQEGFKEYLKALMVRIFAFLSHFRGKLSLYKSLKFYLNFSQAFHFYIQKCIIFERKLINNGGF